MQYPHVIALKGGKVETLLTVQDFEYLIDEYMGFEALKYFRSIREDDAERERELAFDKEDLTNEISALKAKIAELESDFHDDDKEQSEDRHEL